MGSRALGSFHQPNEAGVDEQEHHRCHSWRFIGRGAWDPKSETDLFQVSINAALLIGCS